MLPQTFVSHFVRSPYPRHILQAHFEIEEPSPSSSPSSNSPSKRDYYGKQRSISLSHHITDLALSTRSWAIEHMTLQAFKPQDHGKVYYEASGQVLLVAIIYAALLFVLGDDEMAPGGSMFALMLIWVCSLVGGAAMKHIGMPPLLGMLLSGMILKNFNFALGLDGDDPVSSLPNTWSEGIRASGLSIILMRSGLELDIPAVKKAGLAAVKLTCCPGIAEAFVSALGAYWIFDMPIALAISLGFILAAVSPAVVVVGMFELQKAGYGVLKGIPSLVVAAASFDDVVAISGFSMAIGFAIVDKSQSMLSVAMHGPLTVVFGVGLGVIGGCFLSLTKIWNKRWKRTFAVIGLGMLFMFGMVSIDYSGAGAMGGLIMGMVASVCWRQGIPRKLSKGGEEHYIHHAESDLAMIWSLVSQPLLFGVIGAALDFSKISADVIPKSIAVICLGLTVRLPIAYFSTHGKGMLFKERLFIALSWIPKATVQAALCSLPLDMIKAKMVDDPDYDKYVSWGEDILTTAVFSILITAPLGLIFIQILGPKCLSCDFPKDVDSDDESEDTTSRNSGKGSTTVPYGKGAQDGARFTEDLVNDVVASPIEIDVDSTDVTSVLKKKLHTIKILMDDMEESRTFDQATKIKKIIWQVERISELCTVEVGGQKSLDTSGNFFKVVNSGGAGRKHSESMDRAEVERASRRGSDPTNDRKLLERQGRAGSEGSSRQIVQKHAGTML